MRQTSTFPVFAMCGLAMLGCAAPMISNPEAPSDKITEGGSKTRVVRATVIPKSNEVQGDSLRGSDFGTDTPSWFEGGMSPSVSPTPEMVRDYETNLLLPQGWRRVVERKGDTHTLVYHEPTNTRKEMSLLGLTLTKPRGVASAQALITHMSERLDRAVVLQRTPGPQGILFIELHGERDGITRKLGLLLRQTDDRHAVAFFEAPAVHYTEMGGASLLFAFASGAAPTRVKPSPPKAEPVHIIKPAVQAALLTGAPIPAQLLAGTWYQGIRPPKGGVERLIAQRSLRGVGEGNLLTFRPDGTYQWLYRYNHTENTCTNEVESVETGTYRIDGATVNMEPKTFRARLCPCCKSGHALEMTRLPEPRSLEVGLHKGKEHLAIRGACPTHVLRCEGEQNARVLKMGLTRAQ